MPSHLTPGVYVEERAAGPTPIAGVEMSTAAFVGITAKGSYRARCVASLAEFERFYGPVPSLSHTFLGRAVQGFFANGGRRAWIARVPATRGKFTAAAFIGGRAPGGRFLRGLAALGEIDAALIVAAPDLSHPRMAVHERAMLRMAMIEQAEAKRDRIVLLDAPADDRSLGLGDAAFETIDSPFVAVYGPWLSVAQADGTTGALPPSGHVAGVIARVDAERGVHKSPSGPVVDALGVEIMLSTAEQDELNARGFNALRVFAGRGLQVWGVRLRCSDPAWRYIAMRRFAIFIERSVTKGLGWVVFEPNDEPLWALVRRHVEDFLLGLWRDGALVGVTPAEAFFVRCDRSTMTQGDIDSGRLACMIGFAPLKPAEFVVVRIGVWARHES